MTACNAAPLRRGTAFAGFAASLVVATVWFGAAAAFQPQVMDSVVSVLPRWPGYAQGGQPRLPPGSAPEGTAVAIRHGGYLVTALHVVDRALSVTVRLPDGRHVPAELTGRDQATDLAVLKIDADLPILADAPEPALGDPVCAVGNQFGLDLSVTCGVVSAVHRSGVGFNPIEDFVQTDATVNPGASGGALVDREGRLIGVVSAIFTKQSDADIGVNFAASTALVHRVVDDLVAHGRVVWAQSGLQVTDLDLAERADLVGARVAELVAGGAAARAGVRLGDVLTRVDDRPVRRASDATAAIALHKPGERVTLTVRRGGETHRVELDLPR